MDAKPAEENPCSQCGRWKNPSPTSDAIALKKIDGKEHILLIERGRDPFKGELAVPGGFIDYDEDPADAAVRELEEECGIKGFDPQLVCAPGKTGIIPGYHVIELVYWVEIPENAEVKAGDDAASAKWYPLAEILAKERLAFDHLDIIKKFVEKREQGHFD